MNISKIDENRLEPQTPPGGEKSDGERVKLFTQEQVNKIVEDRLKKEKSKSGALRELKAAVTDLYDKGYFEKYKKAFGKNISLATMIDILLSELGDLKNKSSSDSYEMQSYDAGKVGETGGVRSGTDDPESKPENASEPEKYNFTGTPANPSGNLPEWSMNPRVFEVFAQNKNLPIEKILEEYMQFVMTLEQQRNNKEQIFSSKGQNTAGNGYNSVASSRSARANENFTLTERQKELARAGGLTYREYYEYMTKSSDKARRKF